MICMLDNQTWLAIVMRAAICGNMQLLISQHDPNMKVRTVCILLHHTNDTLQV